MNLERVKQILKKVNALIENLDDQGQTSAIERDLLQRYLRDLYEDVSRPLAVENVISFESDLSSSPIAEREVPTTGVETEMLATTIEENQTTFYDVSATSEPKVETPLEESTQLSGPEDAAINKFENPVQYFPPGEETQVSTTPAVEHAPAAPVASHEEQPVSATATIESTSGRFDAVFVEKPTTDLADKYQLQRVDTIEGAMGINERMLTINELFGGDHNVFMETVTHINELTDFESAQKYLIEGVVTRFEWDADERLSMASDFVQLVRRKFS
jgi:hypothetical protein